MSRKLDAAIAEGLGKDVRWKKWETRGGFDDFTDAKPGKRGAEAYVYHEGYLLDTVSPYSEDGNAMLELIAEMRKQGWLTKAIVLADEKYAVSFFHESLPEIHLRIADNLPEAVALAAYKALTGKDWKE